MDQPYTTVHLMRNKEPLLRRMVCEVRYVDGQLYLDHCGRLIKRLQRDNPEWVTAPEPTPQGRSLYSLQSETHLAFSAVSASLSLDKTSTDEIIRAEGITAFRDQIDPALGVVLDELEVTEFSRLGYREY